MFTQMIKFKQKISEVHREGHPHGFDTRSFPYGKHGTGTGQKQVMGTCEVYKIYQDDGISGYSAERPALIM